MAMASGSQLRCFRRSLVRNQWRSLVTRSSNPDERQHTKQDIDYCIGVVRDRDREGFYCGLLMPHRVQKAFFAIRAFNAEIASIKGGHHTRSRESTGTQDSSTKTHMLQVRLQWWTDAIAQIYGDPPPHISDPALANLSVSCWKSPIVRALNAANEESNLTRRFLERLVEARQSDLELSQFGTMEEAANYAEQSVSSLLYLSLECNGVRDDAADEVASFAGVGIGLTTALRGTPFRLIDGEVTIPGNLLSPVFPYQKLRDSLGGEEVLSEEDSKEWREAVKTMALTASTYFSEARDRQGKVPRSARSSLLPVVPSLLYLSRLENSNFDVLDPTLHEAHRLKLMMMLARTWVTGIF